MSDAKRRIIQLATTSVEDIPITAFIAIDSAIEENNINTGSRKVLLQDLYNLIPKAVAPPEDTSVFAFPPNTIIAYGDKLYQNQTGMSQNFLPDSWPEITIADYINTVHESLARPWIDASTYSVGDIVTYAGKVYKCNTTHSTQYPTPFDPSKWDEMTIADLLTESGKVQDVYVNGVSVLDVNKIAQIKSYKEVTQAEYDALPSSKLTDNILYCIKDSEVSIVNDVQINGTSIVNNGVADIAVDDTPTYISANLITSRGVFNAINPLQQQIGFMAYSIEAEWYNASDTYNVGDYVWQSGPNNAIILYKCIATTTGSWDSSKWEPVTVTSELEKKADKTYVDETIDKLLIHGTASGEITSFSDGADFPMPSLKVGIEPQQDLHGYDAPWAGGAGKNKFDIDATHEEVSGSTTYSYTVTVKPNTAYTMSCNAPQGSPASLYFNGTATNVNGVWNGIPRTFTSDSSGQFTVYVRYDTSQGGIDLYTAVKNGTYYIQLEQGSTATSYAPYSNICPISGWSEANVTVADDLENPTVSNVYTIDLDGTRYGGKLDVVSGVLTVDRVSLTVDENSNIISESGGLPFRIDLLTEAKASSSASALTGVKCNFLKEVTQSSSWGVDGTFSRVTTGAKIVYFKVNSEITTVQQLKTFLQSNNLQFVYELATPLTIQLTPTAVKSLLGSNNVWADCGDVIEANYIRCLDITINDLISRIEALEG